MTSHTAHLAGRTIDEAAARVAESLRPQRAREAEARRVEEQARSRSGGGPAGAGAGAARPGSGRQDSSRRPSPAEPRAAHLATRGGGMVKTSWPNAYTPDSLAFPPVFVWQWHVCARLNEATRSRKENLMLHCEGRQRLMTDEQFQSLLRHGKAYFRRVLLTLRYVPLRPGELSALTWDLIDWQNECFVIPRHKPAARERSASGWSRSLLHLPTASLASHSDRGFAIPVCFLNSRVPSLQPLRIVLLHERHAELGRARADQNGEQLCLYHTRHRWINEAVYAGHIDRVLLQKLGGPESLARTRAVSCIPSRPEDAATRVADSRRSGPKRRRKPDGRGRMPRPQRRGPGRRRCRCRGGKTRLSQRNSSRGSWRV